MRPQTAHLPARRHTARHPLHTLAAAVAMALLPWGAAQAATITVGNGCTLADAITAANTDAAVGGCAAGSGTDTIELTGLVELSAVNNGTDNTDNANGLPIVTSTLTVNGNGHAISRDAGLYRIWDVSSTGNLTLNNVTVKNGSLNGNGAGIRTAGVLTLNDSTVTNNTGSQGVGIYGSGAAAKITVNRSQITGNTGTSGAGILVGGGVELTVGHSTVSGNTATNAGGGISAFTSTVVIQHSTVSGNSATGNLAGGLFLNSNLAATVSNSTVSGNSTLYTGGGILVSGSSSNVVTLSNVTVTGNSQTHNNATPSTNMGGGGLYVQNATVNLNNTLIAGNTKGGANVVGAEVLNVNVGTNIASNGFNLLGTQLLTNAEAFSRFTPHATDITATSDGSAPKAIADILSTTLALNGAAAGRPLTHALVANSPAVNAGNTSYTANGPSLRQDQRGFVADLVANANNLRDIGAFELDGLAPSLPAPTGLTATPGNGQASIAFTAGAAGTAPVSNYKYSTDNGATYTAFNPVVTASPVTLTGLTNGTPYQVKLRAVSLDGDGTESAAVSVTPVVPTVNGACGTAANVATAYIPTANLCTAGTAGAVTAGTSSWGWSCAGSGGGTTASCTAPFAATNGGGGSVGAIQAANTNNWQVRTAQSGFVALPAPAPAGVTFPGGATKVVLDTGTPGTSTTVTLRFSSIPAGAQLYKYGKETGAGDTPKWFPFPATIDRTAGTVTYTLTDGQKGDNDWTVNGVIDDPVGLGVGAGGGVEGVPTLSQWALALLAGFMLLVGARQVRRRH